MSNAITFPSLTARPRRFASSLFLLFMMTAQNASVVLVTRYTRADVAPESLYVINDLVLGASARKC